MNSGGTGSPGVQSCTGSSSTRVGAAQDFSRRIGRVLESADNPQDVQDAGFVVAVQYMHAIGAAGRSSSRNVLFGDAL